jgi:hypothetical protein
VKREKQWQPPIFPLPLCGIQSNLLFLLLHPATECVLVVFPRFTHHVSHMVNNLT